MILILTYNNLIAFLYSGWIKSLVYAAEIVVGLAELFYMVLIVGAPQWKQVANVAVFTVFFDSGGYQS